MKEFPLCSTPDSTIVKENLGIAICSRECSSGSEWNWEGKDEAHDDQDNYEVAICDYGVQQFYDKFSKQVFYVCLERLTTGSVIRSKFTIHAL